MAQNDNILLSLTVTVDQEFRKAAVVRLQVSHTLEVRQWLKQPGAAQALLSLFMGVSTASEKTGLGYLTIWWPEGNGTVYMAAEAFKRKCSKSKEEVAQPLHPSHRSPTASLLPYSLSQNRHISRPSFQGKNTASTS